jgi:NAD(P)-dependent dehydrogenase (short-subunit alcohol dehydrogenase family)
VLESSRDRWRALILLSRGDSGIGKACAVMYAMEGADVAIVYLPEEEVDAKEVERLILKNGESRLPQQSTGHCADPSQAVNVSSFPRISVTSRVATVLSRPLSSDGAGSISWSTTRLSCTTHLASLVSIHLAISGVLCTDEGVQISPPSSLTEP